MITIGFDLDDTLYYKTEPLKKTFIEFNATQGLTFPQFLSTFHKNSDIGFEHFSNNSWSLEDSYVFRITETMYEFGVNITRQEAINFQKKYNINQQKIKLAPYINQTINYLLNKNIQIIIITNGPSVKQRNKISTLGLDRYFPPKNIVVSEEENITKPNIEIFRNTEERLGIDVSKAWFIGDSYQNDIVGATNAGWKTIWLNRDFKKSENHSNIATYTAKTTKDLNEYLLAIT